MKRKLSNGKEPAKNGPFKGGEFTPVVDGEKSGSGTIGPDHELVELVELVDELTEGAGSDEDDGTTAPKLTGSPELSARGKIPPRSSISAERGPLPAASPKKDDVVGPALWSTALGKKTSALPKSSRPGDNVPEAPRHTLLQPLRTIQPVTGAKHHDSAAAIQADLKANGPETLRRAAPVVGPRRRKVDLPEHKESGKVPKKIEEQTGVVITGGNQSGKHPVLDTDYKLPVGASYRGQYSARMLSYLSTVSAAALTLDGVPPTEVQYGHAFNEHGDYELFASTNNLSSQELLAQNLADPSAMTARVAHAPSDDYRAGWKQTSTGKPKNIKTIAHDRNVKHAAKLLRFDELHARRTQAIEEAVAARTIDADEARSHRADLDLARMAYVAFATGNVTVAQSPPTPTEAKKSGQDFEDAAKKRLVDTKKKILVNRDKWNNNLVPDFEKKLELHKAKKDLAPKGKKAKGEKEEGPEVKMPEVALGSTRHAEQNVVQAMHDTNAERAKRGDRLYTFAEIQGTMIRCTGCSAELGANTLDGELEITGRIFGTQASVDRFCDDCNRKKSKKRETVNKNYPVETPDSPGSPHPAFDSES